MEDTVLPDFKDIETKLGRKVPESLVRSFKEERQETRDEIPALSTTLVNVSESSALKRLEIKMQVLKQEMAHLRAIDIKLMHQLLSINEGIESIKWVMEEKGAIASRESSLAGSLYSLSESQDTSLRGSCSSLQDGSDGLDGISVGSYLDTLADDVPGHTSPSDLDHFSDGPIKDSLDRPSLYKDTKIDSDEYYCFGL
ncbi:leucine rich adaptor protein 1-like [Huso huso]|uniref:Leucine rich adaptor protein 1-like n=1 Tax=Huso huso TaxID=61971 RepID=A0ABR1ABM6_HUSHU|nr:leucine rich adaptor protein 1-like [Acipenser ruthenus]